MSDDPFDPGEALANARSQIRHLEEELEKTSRGITALTLDLERAQERFRILVENIRAAFRLTSPDGDELLYVSPMFREIWGLRLDALAGDPLGLLEVVHPDDRDRAEHQLTRPDFDRPAVTFRIVRPGGDIRWVRDYVSPVRANGGPPTHVAALTEDVTSEETTRQQLRKSEARFRKVFEEAPIGMALLPEDLTLVEVNEVLCRMLGLGRRELLGRSLADLEAEDEQRLIAEAARQIFSGESGSSGFQTRLDRDGEEGSIWTRMNVTSLEERERPTLALAMMEDITAQKTYEEELERRALEDPLTGLPNRTLFRDRLRHAIGRARRSESAVAVTVLDLDDFKRVNESLGHQTGDDLLVEVAARIRRALRPDDTVARMGGDEFLLLFEEVASEQEAVGVVARVISEFEAPFSLEGRDVHLTATLGIRLSDEGDEDDWQEIIQAADVALRRAKSTKRTRFAFFDPEEDHRAMRRLEAETELLEGLRDEQFYLEYQPLVELADGRMLGAEALVRWEHPARGRISPGEFIPLAEETGLITSLGRQILRTAARDWVRWQGPGDGSAPSPVLAVNVSAVQLEEPGFLEEMRRVLGETGLDPSCLEVEVTERVLTQSPLVLEEISELGVSIVVDDFGTGYSSLGYLKDLPVDVLKIDLSFVQGLGRTREDRAIVETILTLGETLGMRVRAEGIETEEQLRILRKLGCREAQGYHFGRPVALSDLKEWKAD